MLRRRRRAEMLMGDDHMIPQRSAAGGSPAEQAYVEAVIEHTRRRFMFVTLVYRLLIVAAAAVVVPMVIVLGDQLTPGGLPQAVVYGAGLAWLIASVVCLMGVSTRTMLRRLNRLFVARYVEQRNRLPHNPLVNALLLGEDRRAAHAREAAAHDAATVLHHAADPAAPVSMRRAGLLLGGALLLWGVFALVSPKPILPSLERLFGVHRPAPTATAIELLEPGDDARVYAGEPLRFEVAVSGPPVERVTFSQLRGDGADQPRVERAMQPVPAEARSRRFALLLAGYEVARSFRYRIAAGDAVVEGRIEVRPQPDLHQLAIRLTPPAYTGESPRRTTDPDLHVWAGTRATFDVVANTPIADPVFVLRGESETRTRMRVAADDARRATLATTLTRSGDYWIEFADPDGRPCVDPAVHHLVVRADRPPEVEISAPGRDETPGGVTDVHYVAQLRIRARDDVRLAAVEMVWDAGGRTTRRSLLAGPSTTPSRTALELELATAGLPIGPGQSATVWFEARDNRVLPDGRSAPQVATSRKLRLIRSAPRVAAANDPGIHPGNVTDTTTEVAEPGSQVVRRSPAGEAGENGQSVTASKQGEPTGGLYKPASGKGEVTGDKDGPTIVDPNQVGDDAGGSTRDGDSSGGGSVGDDPNAPAQDGAATEDFKQRLKKFIEQHGAEAREVRGKLGDGSKPEEGARRESRAGGGGTGGEGGMAGNGPGENQQIPPKSENASAESAGSDAPPTPSPDQPGASARDTRSPATQPAPADSGAADRSPAHDTADRGKSHDEAEEPPASRADSARPPPNGGDAQAPDRPAGEQSPTDQPDDGSAGKTGASSSPPNRNTPPKKDGDAAGTRPEENQKGKDRAAGDDSNPAGQDNDRNNGQSDKSAGAQAPRRDSSKNAEAPSKHSTDDGAQSPPADQGSPSAGKQASQPPAGRDEAAQDAPADNPGSEPPETGQAEDSAADQPRQPAAGTHPAQPGANALSGSDERDNGERVIPMGPAPEPLPAPASPGAGQRSPGEGDLAPGGRGDLVDTLELLERADELTEQDLDATGWPPARRQAFIRDLKRLHESARRAGVLSQLRAWTAGRLGSAEVSSGVGLAGGLALRVAPRASVQDRIEQIAPPPQQRVSPELRAVLDAYYRALAARRAAPAGHRGERPQRH